MGKRREEGKRKREARRRAATLGPEWDRATNGEEREGEIGGGVVLMRGKRSDVALSRGQPIPCLAAVLING